jgi:hypothetical protein
MTNSTPTPVTNVAAADIDREAFARTESVRAQMNVANLPHYHLDAIYACGKALWALGRVTPHRDDLLTLPKFDIGNLDHFADYARGLKYAQLQILRRIQRTRQLPEVAAEGFRIRSMMMSYAETLSHKGHFAPELIVRLREGSGYRDLVADLGVLVTEFQGLPASKTGPDAPVTLADLDKAAEIAERINVHVGNAVDPDMSQETLVNERAKLGALLVEAHFQLRRGVGYFRAGEADVNEILPSLFVPPGPRRTTESTADLPPDLATLHEQLHAAQVETAPLPLDPEDHPFTE